MNSIDDLKQKDIQYLVISLIAERYGKKLNVKAHTACKIKIGLRLKRANSISHWHPENGRAMEAADKEGACIIYTRQ